MIVKEVEHGKSMRKTWHRIYILSILGIKKNLIKLLYKFTFPSLMKISTISSLIVTVLVLLLVLIDSLIGRLFLLFPIFIFTIITLFSIKFEMAKL